MNNQLVILALLRLDTTSERSGSTLESLSHTLDLFIRSHKISFVERPQDSGEIVFGEDVQSVRLVEEDVRIERDGGRRGSGGEVQRGRSEGEIQRCEFFLLRQSSQRCVCGVKRRAVSHAWHRGDRVHERESGVCILFRGQNCVL